MANKFVHELDAISTVVDADQIPISDASDNTVLKRIGMSMIRDYVLSGLSLYDLDGDLDSIGDGATYKRVLASAIQDGLVLLSEAAGNLDDVSDGSTYSRVLATDISAGHILLASCIGDIDDIADGDTYGKVLITDISAGHILLASCSGDIDDIADGDTYGKVLATHLSSGKIVLGYGTFATTDGTGQKMILDGSDNTIKLYDADDVLVLKIDDNLWGPGTQPGILCNSSNGGYIRLQSSANNTFDFSETGIAGISESSGYLLQLVRHTQADEGDAIVNLHMVSGLTGDFLWCKIDGVEKFAIDQAGNVSVAGTIDGVDISAHAADVTTKHLPSQASASGKYLKSNGSVASWETVTVANADTVDGYHASAFSLTGHNHDTAYSAIGHGHSGTYEPAGTVATHAGLDAQTAHGGLGTAAVYDVGDFAAAVHGHAAGSISGGSSITAITAIRFYEYDGDVYAQIKTQTVTGLSAGSESGWSGGILIHSL